MAKGNKNITDAPPQKVEEDIIPTALLNIFCALLQNPNIYPKTNDKGIMDQAKRLNEMLAKDFM